MRVTVLGSCGAWPEAGGACSGFLIEYEGFRLVIDLGYATMPRLLRLADADQIDAVFISHGHPDHCADLSPLLRARALADSPSVPLPVFALPGSLDAVFALDRPGMLADAYRWHEFEAGARLEIGPFQAETRLLPHWVPNAGIRLTAGGRVLAYTGDAGPDPEVVTLARDADLLLAEATYVDEVPRHSQGNLTSAREAGRQATQAGASRLMLTHLWPGTSRAAARAAAEHSFAGPVEVASPELTVDLL
jgi:ribonuclease BN (tRNA processing enzyme)